MNIAKLTTYFANRNLYHALQKATKIQYASMEQLNAFREEKFNKLITHAKLNVPYYKDKFEHVKTISDINKIPILSKIVIKENFNHLKATNFDKSRFIDNSTSGSTGESTYFFSDMDYAYRKAVNIRADEWAGWRYGERALHLWGAERDIEKNKSLYKKIKHNFIVKEKMLSTYHLSVKDMNDYIKIYNSYKPGIIISYPTPLHRLAQHIEEHNIKIFTPKGIITSSETLFPFQREKIENIFKAKVFNRYGCREFGNIATECEMHNGLHINSDRFIIEIVDEKGNKCENGTLGEILVTDLDNFVFPFIRYKIGDLAIMSETACTCRRNLPLLEKVEGRVFEMIQGPNGNVVAGTFWTLLRNKVEGFSKFQIIQNKIDEIQIIVENNNKIGSDFDSKLISLVREKLGYEMKVIIDKIDKIPLTETGKHRWIISKLSPYAT